MKLAGGIWTLVFLAIVAGCAPSLQPLPPSVQMPQLTGRWEGTWAGTMTHPMNMEVTEQKEGRVSGAVIFITQQYGERTFPMAGTLGLRDGKLVFVIDVGMGGHSDRFEFTTIEPTKLEGQGYGKHHTGPVSLMRR